MDDDWGYPHFIGKTPILICLFRKWIILLLKILGNPYLDRNSSRITCVRVLAVSKAR